MTDSKLPCVLVFGGTSEGREIVQWLAARESCDVIACAASKYGSTRVAQGPHVSSVGGPLYQDELRELVAAHEFLCVVDATHPYATHISNSVAAVTGELGVPLVRLVREDEPSGTWMGADDAKTAAHMLNKCEGNILLTTGSKDLAVYAEIVEGFFERVYARILPVLASLEAAHDLGVAADHIIAMQGPFSADLNAALVKQLDIRVLVTKASGKAGGFWEKVEAAQRCDIQLIVIHRPTSEHGLDYNACKRVLVREYGL